MAFRALVEVTGIARLTAVKMSWFGFTLVRYLGLELVSNQQEIAACIVTKDDRWRPR
jgi:hypothetical protein